ncbi:HAMP domain-containing sensor histidine kinase [soil metagenome]
MSQGLPHKLRYVFIVQAVLASFAIVIGFYFVGMLVKESLASERVRAEADAYWTARARDPDYPLPRTTSVSGYFVPADAPELTRTLPVRLRELPDGYHDLPGRMKALVEARPRGRLYLMMSFPLLDRVVWWTGLVSMLMALLAIYAVSWLSYRSARRLVAPVDRLAQAVSAWDPRDPDIEALGTENLPGHPGREVQQLGGALRELATRTQAFVQRERDFTRDASHELRTPLTVIRVATDLMRSDPETPERMQRPLLRVQRAGQDMEAVIDAFLILAREAESSALLEEFDVHDVVWESVEKTRPLLAGRPVELVVIEEARPRLLASSRVLAVMLDNLLSNACSFTEAGRVEVRIEADRILVSDTGIGMAPETLQRVYDPFYRADQFNAGGKGMGLSIVRRLGERFGWPITLESTAGTGTEASIKFSSHLAG